MTLKVKTTIFPFRISLQGKETWELQIEIENADPKPKKGSLRVELPEQATFKNVGQATLLEKQFDHIKPNEKIMVKETIYPSRIAEPGNFVGTARVAEHYQDYDYVIKESKSEFAIRLVK
ncbi:MAG TPA: hypothetical protein VFF13_03225 [archaeon]|nr:hypothetical protein [archaeon]